jgi:chromosomal replication initiation ATPase DnaA
MNMPTIPNIKKAVAGAYNVSVKDIDSRTRKQPIATARQAVLYYGRKLLGLNFQEMQSEFGRHHTSCIHSYYTIIDRREYDPETRDILNELESEFPWLKNEVPAKNSRKGHRR